MRISLATSLTSAVVMQSAIRPPVGMSFLKYTNADGKERIAKYTASDNAEKRMVYTRAS